LAPKPLSHLFLGGDERLTGLTGGDGGGNQDGQEDQEQAQQGGNPPGAFPVLIQVLQCGSGPHDYAP